MPRKKRKAYESQRVAGAYRVTHVGTDSRIATCYDKDNAALVTEALNALDPKGQRYP